MLPIKPRQKNQKPLPSTYQEDESELEIIPLTLDTVQEISSVKINLPNNLTT
jgi:hypothetical protein